MYKPGISMTEITLYIDTHAHITLIDTHVTRTTWVCQMFIGSKHAHHKKKTVETGINSIMFQPHTSLIKGCEAIQYIDTRGHTPTDTRVNR